MAMGAKKKKSKLLRLLIPGFLFQSVVIGGGYGTGAEIKQYFLMNGLKGGMAGMGVTLFFWSVVCAVTFEFARTFKTYDYKSMMSELLGKFGILYELCYVVLMLIVLGVVNATGGSMVADLLGVSPWFGIIGLSVGIIILVIKGTEAIEAALTFWSYILYVVYALFMFIVFSRYGGNLSDAMATSALSQGDWFLGGTEYAFYNLGIIPAILYTVHNCDNRKEALTSGALAGAIAIVPAFMLLLVMGTQMDACATAEVPIIAIFDILDMQWLYAIFEIVLFGTLIATGTGFIKAVDDRIENTIIDSGADVAFWIRPTVACICVALGVAISRFGLTELISQGYGTITWGFLFAFAIPMLTIGVWKIANH